MSSVETHGSTPVSDQRKEASSHAVVIDDLLEQEVGPCGLWQWSLVVLGMLSTSAATTFPVFSDTVPLRRCRMDDAVEEIFGKFNLNFSTIGKLIGGWTREEDIRLLSSGCRRFNATWDEDFVRDLIAGNATYDGNQTVPCSNGYVYDYLEFQYHGGIATDFDMVCDRVGLISTGTSIVMVGMILGFGLGGAIGTKYGLKKSLIIFTSIELIASALCCLSNSFWLYTFFRFMICFGAYGKLCTFNVILLDITTPTYRSLVNAFYLIGFNFVSRALLALYAYLLTEWRWLSLLEAIHSLFVISYFFVVPESPRWELSKGHPIKALKILILARRVNMMWPKGVDSDSEKLTLLLKKAQLESNQNNSTGVSSNKALSSTPNVSTWYVIKTTIIGTVMFTFSIFTFFGLLLYTRLIKQPVYLISAITSLVSLPGAFLAIVVYRFTRHRRLPIIVTYTISGLIILTMGTYTYVVQPEGDLPLVTAVVVCTALAVAIQSMLFIYIPELYPPSIRSSGFGICAGVSRIGAVVSETVNNLDYTMKHGFPALVYGSGCFVCALLLTLLPDTTGSETATNSGKCENNESITRC